MDKVVPVDPEDAERTTALLSVAENVLHDDVSYRPPPGRDPEALDTSLGQAMRALSGRADRRDAGIRDLDGEREDDTLREQTVWLQLGIARSSLRTATLSRDAQIVDLSALLRVLRSFCSLADLLDGAPAEIHRVGFGRVLLSRVQDGLWLPRSCSVVDDPELARHMVRLGAQYPGTLNGAMVETEMVRRQQPILVRDAARNPRVHQQLRDLIDCQAYVSAPLVAHGAVAGLVHADQNLESGTVDTFDRELLGLVAEGLGLAIERTVFFERLQQLRHRVNEHTAAVNDLIDEFADGEIELSAVSPVPPGAVPGQAPATRGRMRDERSDELPSCLTRREADVLRHVALGETNAQIAHRLFVSEGTVKSHVKHILRKLGAANRAEAVSRHHQMMADPECSPRGR
jgi:DNA-binding CsgD family transcriptional regulator/GAF domain-containing protein